jgi:hypothetical protein
MPFRYPCSTWRPCIARFCRQAGDAVLGFRARGSSVVRRGSLWLRSRARLPECFTR